MTSILKTLLVATPLLTIAAFPVFAAEGVGGKNEKELMVEGTVVDILCEIAKKCTPNCGEGKRQLGLKLDDGKLLAVVKNTDLFAGSQADLAPHCGKKIWTDGILFENPKMPVYMVQGIKTTKDAKEFTPVDGFVKAWTAKNGTHEEWFRNDPTIKAQIAKTGPLGDLKFKPKAQ